MGHFQKSNALMKSISSVIKVPEIMGTMREMSREMMKAGIIDEMITDAMDSAFGDEDLVEEETAAEVDRVLRELAVVDAAQMPAAASAPIPAPAAKEASAGEEEEEEEEVEEELDPRLQQRLDAIRS